MSIILPLTAHRRIMLHRHFPGLRIEERSINCVRIFLGDCFIQVYLAPFAGWIVSWPYVDASMLYPPSDHEAWSLRDMLLEWVEGSRPER